MSRVSRMTGAMCHDTRLMWCSLRAGHISTEVRPCHAVSTGLHRPMMRDKTERGEGAEQSRTTECRHHTTPDPGFQKRYILQQYQEDGENVYRPCRNESSCWCLVTQTPVCWVWTVARLASSASQGRQAGLRCHWGSVATTLHTDTLAAQNGSQALAVWHSVTHSVYIVNRNLRGLWRWTGLSLGQWQCGHFFLRRSSDCIRSFIASTVCSV